MLSIINKEEPIQVLLLKIHSKGFKMGLFNNLIEDKLKIKKNNRYTSVSNFSDYLAFLGYIGRIDEIYISLRLTDKSYVDNNEIELLNFSTYKNLESLVVEIEEKDAYDIKKYLLETNYSEIDTLNLTSEFLAALANKEASHEENLVLNFLLNKTLSKNILGTDLGIRLVEYFWRAKNCNNYRKDYCIFSIVDFFIRKNSNEFFQLKKQYYNHIQKIYSQIQRSSFLVNEENNIYQTYFNSKIKNSNKLKSKTNNRVAVCISGLYRNHIEALENIKKNIVEPLNADVFIHTWDEKSIWTGNGGSPNIKKLLGDSATLLIPNDVDNLEKIQKILPKVYDIIQHPVNEKWDGTEVTNILKPKKILIENQEDFESSITDKADYLLARGSLNQIKMFYGIKKSFDLAFEAGDYDYIIRIRPDTAVNSKISIEDINGLNNNTIYTGVWLVGLFDADFVVASSVAYNLSSFIAKMFDFNALSPYEDFPLYDSHNLILAWLLEFNYYFDKPIFNRGLLSMSERKISIEGLAKALNEDFNNLSEDNKLKFLPFIQYLKTNYC